MTSIRLMGAPAIVADEGTARVLRGRKAWALLAYLLLADRPPSRKRLAELLFADADDPLGALRWTLAELRRNLGAGVVLAGDPIVITLEAGTSADVLLLTKDSSDPATLLDLSGELLEGVQLPACPEIESWLLVERHRLAGMIEAKLREAAMSLVASGRPGEAVSFAAKAVAINQLEQGNHELLVRCLALTGDRPAALRQVAVCEDLLRRELAVTPSPALLAASTLGPGSPSSPALSGRAAAMSQLEAGRAAIVAGAVDAGLQCLRRAVAEAGHCNDAVLRGRALSALGSALVHAIRGHDEEGAIVLHEAILVAERAGDRATSVDAHRELGFVEVQAGRRSTAVAWLSKAHALAETDAEYAAILGVQGMNSSDSGDYPAAFEHLGESVELAAKCGNRRQQAWSLSITGRAHLLRGEQSQAAATVRQSLELVRQERWIAFLPWPQALKAELDWNAGDLEAATDGFEQAWALSCQLNDPCWEGMAARGLGLLSAGRGDDASATSWLDQAATRSSREPDRYQWVHAHVLDAAITAALDRGDDRRARPLVSRLTALAARCELKELTVRANLHRARLGDPLAATTARHLATSIDNPALTALLR
ncbi:DNA-binding SARP family transcriptional activator [Kribbella voronezhensis]|uniref:DNA-binding SARP family transcriptional activator n=1 Tax=Kribbella voronezhensis TaxID=2512212 RepID=A0A4R7SYI3_9ACTN|nr:BTAD domain-containing putative transcriptional regulator [Kribbella voronezhensis]TDU83577.1 DNA-binding SARP family transcriptional activator [Kribbella voronezhensis]